MNAENSKVALRKDLIQRRKFQFNNELQTYQEHSNQAAQHILAQELWKKAQKVGLYMPIGGEMGTELLYKNAYANGKKVYFPRCHPDKNGQMNFIACAGINDLKEGAYGIYEPRQNLIVEHIDLFHLNLLIMPGVAFDKSGYRLGFGGGYYDRFLQLMKNKKIFCLGLAFSWQIVDYVQREVWDIPVNAVATEGGILWI